MSELLIGQQEHIAAGAKGRRWRCRLLRWAKIICALVVLSLSSGAKYLSGRVEVAAGCGLLLIFWVRLLRPTHRPIMSMMLASTTCTTSSVLMDNRRWRRMRWRWTIREGSVRMLRRHWLLIIGILRLLVLVVSSHAMVVRTLSSGGLGFIISGGTSTMVVLASDSGTRVRRLLVFAWMRLLLIVATVVVLSLIRKVAAITCRRVASHATWSMTLKGHVISIVCWPSVCGCSR